MDVPRIGIILGTTRKGRFSETAARWIESIARQRSDIAVELLDLRDYDLPLLDAPMPSVANPDRRSKKCAAGPERSPNSTASSLSPANTTTRFPPSSRTLSTSAMPSSTRKAATYVAYGTVGGARAVEHLRQIGNELQLASSRWAVHIGMEAFVAVAREGRQLTDFEALQRSANAALGDLVWWVRTLRVGRLAAA